MIFFPRGIIKIVIYSVTITIWSSETSLFCVPQPLINFTRLYSQWVQRKTQFHCVIALLFLYGGTVGVGGVSVGEWPLSSWSVLVTVWTRHHETVVPKHHFVLFCWDLTTTMESWNIGNLPQNVHEMACIDPQWRCCAFSKMRVFFFLVPKAKSKSDSWSLKTAGTSSGTRTVAWNLLLNTSTV